MQAAVAELDSEAARSGALGATGGSSLVGYDGGTVQDVLDGAKSLQDYAALRAYTGRAKRVYITGLLATAKPAGIAGVFQYDSTDTTSSDNGGTIIVGADGRRWKRDFSGFVNVKWFGAMGDGINDDTTPIKNAINTLIAYGGGKLLFQEGVYKSTSQIDIIDASDIEIIGESGAVIKSDSAYQIVIFIDNSNNISISGLKFIKNYTVVKTQNRHVIYSYRSDLIRFENNYIDGADEMGFTAKLSSNIFVNGNRVINAFGTGIWCTDVNSSITITNNIVTGRETGDDCILLGSTSSVVPGGFVKGVISGNICSNSSANGIDLIGASNVSVYGNVIDNCRNSGIFVGDNTTYGYGSSKNISISGNTISNIGTFPGSATSKYGILMTACEDIAIVGNTINYTVNDGISGVSGTKRKNITISSNVIDCGYSTSAGSYGKGQGINIVDDTNINVVGNKIKNVFAHGIQLFGTISGGSVASNTIVNWGADSTYKGGVYVGSTVSDVTVSDNRSIQDGTTTPGVYVKPVYLVYPANINNVISNNGEIHIAGYVDFLWITTNDYFKRAISNVSPTQGTWATGDIVYKYNAAAGGFVGWYCTAGGTPGTWKTFGAISA